MNLAELDHAHVWHPFTPMRQWCEQDPLIIERGEGPYLFDTEGNRYIDGVSSLWCNLHGHRVPHIDQAIRDQLDKIAHTTLLGLASPPSIELAARLVQLVNAESGSVNPQDGNEEPQAASNASPSVASSHRTSHIAHRRLNKVFYSDAGATALEVAFKMAVGYWHHTGHPDKTRFIGLQGAYHGDTVGSMSVGYSDLFHRPFSSMTFPVDWFPCPDPVRLPPDLTRTARPCDTAPDPLSSPCHAADAPDGFPNHQSSIINHQSHPWPSEDPALTAALTDHCLGRLREMLEAQADRTAAIVIEPVMQGAAGMVCQPPGFLAGVAQLARQHNVLLICDEVATGFARTGTLFAFQSELSLSAPQPINPSTPASPDILCLAKGLTAGYLPLAVTMTTDAIYDAFTGEPDERKTLYHGHTYTGNPLACAAALASLDLLQKSPVTSDPCEVTSNGRSDTCHLPLVTEPFLTHTRRSAELIREKLHALRGHPAVIDIRQRGLMVGIELVATAARREDNDPEPFQFTAPLGRRVCDLLRGRGVLLRPLGNVLVLMPIPAMPHDVLSGLLDATVQAVQECSGEVE